MSTEKKFYRNAFVDNLIFKIDDEGRDVPSMARYNESGMCYLVGEPANMENPVVRKLWEQKELVGLYFMPQSTS